MFTQQSKSANKLLLVAVIFCTFLSLEVFSQPPLTIIDAVKKNDFNAVKTFMNKGADVNSTDEEGDPLIMNAALYASTEIMELLLKNSANANALNKDGATALMWAVHDLQKIKLLIKYGADINAKANTGNTPLLIACVGNDRKETIKFLLENGADPLMKNKREETALMRTALFGDSASLALLLKKGMEINAKDKEGLTALINALFNVNREATFFLLDNGADPDMVAAFGLTAVTSVVTYNDLPSVKAVLNKAKNINTVDDLGNSALMWAVYNEHDNTEIIKALLDKGANPKIISKNGATALSWAQKKGNTKTVALLKKAIAQ